MKDKYQIFISPDYSNDMLGSCYLWWQNFINTELADYNGDPIEGNLEWEAYRDQVFAEHKITYVDYDEVYFDSEEDFTLFVLRYS
jgi:hypothetical protein